MSNSLSQVFDVVIADVVAVIADVTVFALAAVTIAAVVPVAESHTFTTKT